jgi:N-methylhydantoinase A
LPVVREYERSLATILNAAVMPGVANYVRRLEGRLADEDISAPLLLMQSNGGVAGSRTIRRAPALTVLSGPAAGVVGAREVAASCGFENIITVDIGGTSADIALVEDGRIGLTQHGQVGDWPLSLPMVDMVTIGAGGGSIARVADAALSVGPQSAGADPGPACYGRGGEDATVTDAHVVLGQLPESLLAGGMPLDKSLAERSVRERVAEPLGLGLIEAARGILAIIDSNMVGAIRVVSVERGHDPRDFTLVAFGGAGPLHGCGLADLLGIRRVLIPPAPGILCAEGLLAAELRAEYSRTLPKAGRIEPSLVEQAYAELEGQARRWFDEENVAPADRGFSRVALLRYHGQGGELAVPWGAGASETEKNFSDAHQALYGFTLDAPIELVTVRIEAIGKMPAPVRAVLPPGSGPSTKETRLVHLADGAREIAVLDREGFGAGDRFTGPAIVTQLDATTLVSPGWSGEVHPSGSLLLTRD